jgi:DNA replication and repair protein RecF
VFQINKTNLVKHSLTNYRNFKDYLLEIDSDLILITGRNGSGKTNILESISYLSPGKGIRSSNFEFLSREEKFAWQTESLLSSKIGTAEICAKFDIDKKQRALFYNGSKISSHELSRLVNIIWLTPQMNGIFIAPRSERLRFLDRMVFGFFKNHSANLNKLDYFQSERLKHLTNNIGNFDASWLKVLESKIAEHAFEIDHARRKSIFYMQDAIGRLQSDFPKAKITLKTFDNEIQFSYPPEVNKNDNKGYLLENEAVRDDFYNCYLNKLKEHRYQDACSGRTNYGAQKVDLVIFHQDKEKDVTFCSTGEQKAMLISLFIAQVNSIIDKTKATPILLFDELFVHLDDLRKQLLSDYVINIQAQCFITSTDDYGITDIAKAAQRISL